MIEVLIAVLGIVIIVGIIIFKAMYHLGNNYNLSSTIFGNAGIPGTKGYGKEKIKTNKKWNSDGSLN